MKAIPEDVKGRIKIKAATEWSGDFEMQQHTIDQDIDTVCLAQRRYWIKAGARLGTLAVACSLLLAFFDLGGPLAALIIIIDAGSTILATTVLCMLLTKAHSPASMAVVDATEQQRLLARYHSLAPSPDSAAHRYILRVLEQGRGFRRVELQLLEAQLQLHAQPTSPSRPTMPGLSCQGVNHE